MWGSLPCLSWLCPWIGHLGITDSDGRVHDFAGPYTICIDQFMTGPVYKYWQMDPRTIDFPSLKNGEARDHAEAWDLALERGDKQYKKMMVFSLHFAMDILALQNTQHTLCWNNCHSHVRCTLNHMGINDGTWVMIFKFMYHAKYVSLCRMLIVYVPFLVIVCLFLLFSMLGK